MDYCVHRLRFADWQPAPIKTLAGDPFSCRLAVGREDGDIEIRDSRKWYNQVTIPGQSNFNLQSLTWAAEKSESGRLFGISLRGFIFEIDLSSLSVKNIRDSYGGAAWCLASCPRHCFLAVGCEDGAARQFRYDGDVLEYVKGFPTTGSRILCLAYHPALPRLFMGCDDGTIRCVDESTGRSLFRMTGDVLRGVSTYIWSIQVLSDSTVVSGDSRGHVQLWDGETGVLMITLHQHTAEVLALAVSTDETQIFASGVDCRVTCVRKVPCQLNRLSDSNGEAFSAPAPSDSNWVYSTSHRPHSHDVFALATCNYISPFSNGFKPLLLSGGMDTKLCSYSIEEFARTRPSWILPVAATGLVQSSSDYTTVAVRHRNRLDIWNVLPSPLKLIEGEALLGQKRKGGDDFVTDIEGEEDSIDNESKCNLSLRLETKGPEHIHCFSLSTDGTVVACSTAAETRIWSLKKSDSSGINVKKLVLPYAAQGFCHALAFSCDGKRLAAYTAKGALLLLSLGECVIDNNDMNDAIDQDNEEDESIIEENLEDEEEQLNSDDDVDEDEKEKTTKSPKNATMIQNISKNGLENDKEEKELRVSIWHSFDHSSIVSEMQDKNSADSARNPLGLSKAVTKIVFSSDGMYLAVADAQNAVYVYDIDRLRLHWRLPLLSTPVTSIAFHPQSTASLVVTETNNSFLVYEADGMCLSEWSKSNNSEKIMTALKSVNGPVCGVTFDPSSDCSMLLYGQGFIVYIDLTQSIPKHPKIVLSAPDKPNPFRLFSGIHKVPGRGNGRENKSHGNGKGFGHGMRRKSNGGEDSDSNFAIIQRYRSMVHVGCVADSQLVIVENPWVRVLNQLPDTLMRKRYGT